MREVAFDPWTHALMTPYSPEQFNDLMSAGLLKQQNRRRLNSDTTATFLHEQDHAARTVTSSTGLLLRAIIHILQVSVLTELSKGSLKDPIIPRKELTNFLFRVGSDIEGNQTGDIDTRIRGRSIDIRTVVSLLALAEEISGYCLEPEIMQLPEWLEMKTSGGYSILLGIGAAFIIDSFVGNQITPNHANHFINSNIPASWNLPDPLRLLMDQKRPTEPMVYGKNLTTKDLVEALGMRSQMLSKENNRGELYRQKPNYYQAVRAFEHLCRPIYEREPNRDSRLGIPTELGLCLEIALDSPIEQSYNLYPFEFWPAWRFATLALGLAEIPDYQFQPRKEATETVIDIANNKFKNATQRKNRIYQQVLAINFDSPVEAGFSLQAAMRPFSENDTFWNDLRNSLELWEKYGWYGLNTDGFAYSYCAIIGENLRGEFNSSGSSMSKLTDYDRERSFLQVFYHEGLRRLLLGKPKSPQISLPPGDYLIASAIALSPETLIQPFVNSIIHFVDAESQ